MKIDINTPELYTTRDGNPLITLLDNSKYDEDYPVAYLIDCGSSFELLTCTEDGRYFLNSTREHDLDLIIPSKVKKVFIAIMQDLTDGTIYCDDVLYGSPTEIYDNHEGDTGILVLDVLENEITSQV